MATLNPSLSAMSQFGMVILCFVMSSILWGLLLAVATTCLDTLTSWIAGTESIPAFIAWSIFSKAVRIGTYIFVFSCLTELLMFSLWLVVRLFKRKRDGQVYPMPVFTVHGEAMLRSILALSRQSDPDYPFLDVAAAVCHSCLARRMKEWPAVPLIKPSAPLAVLRLLFLSLLSSPNSTMDPNGVCLISSPQRRGMYWSEILVVFPYLSGLIAATVVPTVIAIVASLICAGVEVSMIKSLKVFGWLTLVLILFGLGAEVPMAVHRRATTDCRGRTNQIARKGISWATTNSLLSAFRSTSM